MPRQWPSEEIPDDNLVPKGTFHFEITELPEAEVNGKLVYKPDLTCVEPKAFKGRKLFGITYWIGTDEDKQANDPETWKASTGARDLKKLIVASGVKPTPNVSADCEKATGRIVGITVGKRARKTDPDRVDNTIAMCWPAGTRALEVFDEEKPARPNGPVAMAPRPAPAPPPVVEEEEEEEESPPPPPAKVTPAPVRSTEPLQAPKPGKKGDMRTCPKCKQEFARNVLADHVKACYESDVDEDEED